MRKIYPDYYTLGLLFLRMIAAYYSRKIKQFTFIFSTTKDTKFSTLNSQNVKERITLLMLPVILHDEILQNE